MGEADGADTRGAPEMIAPRRHETHFARRRTAPSPEARVKPCCRGLRSSTRGLIAARRSTTGDRGQLTLFRYSPGITRWVVRLRLLGHAAARRMAKQILRGRQCGRQQGEQDASLRLGRARMWWRRPHRRHNGLLNRHQDPGQVPSAKLPLGSISREIGAPWPLRRCSEKPLFGGRKGALADDVRLRNRSGARRAFARPRSKPGAAPKSTKRGEDLEEYRPESWARKKARTIRA